MKHSPLCSWDDGREIYFTAKDRTQKLRFTVSRDVLDRNVGDTAPTSARKSWVKDNMSDILNIRTGDGTIAPPFDLIHVEEIA